MPQKQEHRTRPSGRVRIKDTMTHLYDDARVYNEGVVKSQMHDSYGYPLIFVEWDKNHWAYSGEQDRWVLEAHFDPVEEDMADEDKKPDFMDALADLIKEYRTEPPEAEKANSDPRPQGELTYDDVLSKGTEGARNGEAFVMIVASVEDYAGSDVIIPHIYMHSKDEDAGLLIDAAIADYVAQTYARLVQEHVKGKRDGQAGS